MRKTDAAIVMASLLAGMVAARACFPGASWQLLDDRHATLHAPPANSFAWEAQHLAPASPWAHARSPGDAALDAATLHDRAERAGLTRSQLLALADMRAAPDSRWALSAAGALPEAVRLYTGGAVAFLHGNLTDAREYFSFVLALPPDRAAPRAVWAQYMLGRVAMKQGHGADAEAAFAAVRDRVMHGAPDPLNLATASLGEQARLRLDRGDVAGAAALYAEQAADGSDEAVQSLRIVAEGAMKQPQTLPALVRDRLVQRLLVVHALGLTGDYLHQVWIGGTAGSIGADGFFPPDGLDTKPLKALLDAIRASGVRVAELDRLAALAYRLGDLAAAHDLAMGTSTPLALWVRAKLALEQDGGAAPLFAAALHAAEADRGSASVEPAGTGLLRGETAVATLARGDFMQAAEVMWPVAATYWGDFAYLAERVLTTDELRRFATAHAAVPVPVAKGQVATANELRSLLARRLMRDGRTEDALAWFDAGAEVGSDTRADAAAYGAAAARALAAVWPTDRARAAWTAARLLRTRGMEMMGTEEGPDQADIGGERAYFLGPGPAGPFAQNPDDVADAEPLRYDASRPRPDLRFHYRYLAVDQALAAAAELPPRSQAYAAILCQAAGWSLNLNDRDRARAIWQSYVAHGARVPFAAHFGRACPEPAFDAVWQTRQRTAVVFARNFGHRRKPVLLAGGVIVLALAGLAVLRRRRKPA